MEWIRFGAAALLLFLALSAFTSAVIGVWRFGFVLNRMHAAGIGDTLGLFAVTAALVVCRGISLASAKIILLVVFMWFTSPASSHFLSQIEYYTNPHLYRYTDRRIGEEEPERKEPAEKGTE